MKYSRFFLVFSGVLGLLAGCKFPYRLTMEDTLCRVGEKSRLVARLQPPVMPDFDQSIAKKDLSFYLNDLFIGIHATNNEGLTSITHRFPVLGVQRLKVIFDDNRGRFAETTSRVFVWGKNDPVLLVNIDGAIRKTNKPALAFSSEDSASAPQAGAPEALNKLSLHFHIVYLTARPRESIPKIRQWLKDNEFPSGPVLAWDLGKDLWSTYDSKRNRIDQIQDDFNNVRFGIGTTEKDYEAYKNRNLFSFLIDPNQPAAPLDRGCRVPDWQALFDLFKRNPQLYNTRR